ncbi:Calcitonin receptor-like protein 1 [Toxocara canis]|uniref:Calcitonin receptor-like protein 1 n=1 Tax=Toxocara canis TaxID=6265 RepID=A0A0B2VM31_TOXCA|nr:Calcitonin receptor-like protein 1 [Toxocara canis]
MSTGSLLLAHDRPSTSTSLQNVSTLIEIQGLEFNRADTMEECVLALERSNLPTFPDPADGSLWCNATFDTVLCWPATPANTSITLRCPPLKGLDPEKNISKWCHSSGRWMGREEGDFSRAHGWTNFTMCFTQEVIDMMTRLTNGSLGIAQEVARNARKLEFVGLGLSLVSLLISIAIFSYFRRLRVFRNLLHLQLMIAILMVVVIRLVLYIDLIFTDRLGPAHTNPDGKTINTMVFVCEAMFFLLEYFKTVAFGWMFLEGFYLHNQLVFTVFNSEPRLTPYLIAGYGFPLAHTFLWLGVILFKKQGKVERCLGSYYLEPEFWILDGPRMFELVINLFFICNVIRVLWTKVRESHNTSEMDRMKKSVKAALMLIPLLGIPNIMQTIPFSPTQENIMYFAIWTYCASFTYMYQGLMITIIYCFTNKEVQNVLKTCYGRYRLQHTSTNELRRGSRTVSAHYQTKNGVLMTTINGNTLISPYQSMNKKISCDTTADVVAPIVQQRPQEVTTNNGSVTLDDYATTTVSERTPLRNVGRCDSENVSVDNNDRYHSISRDRTRSNATVKFNDTVAT